MFMRRRGATETQKQSRRCRFGTQISPKRPQPLNFTSVFQASCLATKAYRPYQRRVSQFCDRSVGRKTTLEAGFKVAAILGWFFGPREPSKGARRPTRDRPECVKCASRPDGVPTLQKRPKLMETIHFEMCTLLERQVHVGQQWTLITKEG